MQARVRDGVLNRAADQALVGQHDGVERVFVQVELEGVQLVEAAVHMLGDHAAQKARQMDALEVERLHVVVEFRGGVEVGDEILDLEPLRADDLSVCAHIVARAFVGGDGVGVAQDHRQRRADVVGYAADPVRAGGVLLLDDAARLGDALADLAQIPLQVQFGGPSFGQRIERIDDGAHRALRAPSRDRVEDEQDAEVDCEHEEHVQRQVGDGGGGVGEAFVPVLSLREAHDEQAVVAIPEKRRVIGDLGVMRGHGDVVRGEGARHLVGDALRPGHGAALVHEKRPGVPLVERPLTVLGKRPCAVLSAREGGVHGAHRGGGRVVVVVLVRFAIGDEGVQEEVDHHDEERERYEHEHLLREEPREARCGGLPSRPCRPRHG